MFPLKVCLQTQYQTENFSQASFGAMHLLAIVQIHQQIDVDIAIARMSEIHVGDLILRGQVFQAFLTTAANMKPALQYPR